MGAILECCKTNQPGNHAELNISGKWSQKRTPLQLDKLSTKDSELNEFLSQNHISPKVVYQYFDEEQLNDFMTHAKQVATHENRKLGTFELKQDQESVITDPSNTRAGMAYKYFGELEPKTRKRQGMGYCVWADGSTYRGQWENDRKHGSGNESWLDDANYEGEFLKGLKHGKGIFCWPNEDTYTGEFKNNNIEGLGTYEWADGRVFHGEWINNKMHGKGKFTWIDGRTYDGDYIEDVKEGHGIFTWKDGRKYVGAWKNGKQHGEGVFTDSKGNSRNGVWEDGNLVDWTD